VVSNHFLSNTYMSASYRRATRLARWNKKPSESSVRRVLNHTLQRTGDIALLSSLCLVAAVAEVGSLVVIAAVPTPEPLRTSSVSEEATRATFIRYAKRLHKTAPTKSRSGSAAGPCRESSRQIQSKIFRLAPIRPGTITLPSFLTQRTQPL